MLIFLQLKVQIRYDSFLLLNKASLSLSLPCDTKSALLFFVQTFEVDTFILSYSESVYQRAHPHSLG